MISNKNRKTVNNINGINWRTKILNKLRTTWTEEAFLLYALKAMEQFVLTQSENTQPDDDLFTGSDAGDQPVQNAVITNKRHHSLRKLCITGDIQRRAAVKHGQRLTEDTQR